jgi:hypothetical protein
MALLAPPPAPPPVAQADRDGFEKFRLRLLQIVTATITVLVTVWMCTLGVIPAIIALMVAKHVLVAILMMGIDANAHRSL